LSPSTAHAACFFDSILNTIVCDPSTAPSDTFLGALADQSSRLLRDTLDRRLEKLRQASAGSPARASGASPQFASLDIAADRSGGERQAVSNLWASAGHGWLNSDSAAANFRGYQNVATLGFDHTVLRNLTLGLALSGDKIGLETRTNGGSADVVNATLMPYARWGFADAFSVDASAGLTRSHIAQEANGVRGDAHAWREMVTGGLNYDRLLGSWFVGGKIGTLFVWEQTEPFTDSIGDKHEDRYNTLGQMQAGASVGRLFAWGGINLSATYLYDFDRFVTFDQAGRQVPAPDRDGVNVGLSANTAIASTLNLELAVSHEFFRAHTDNTLLSARLAYTF
jgi:outer membrane autotransporter protein